MKTELPEPDSSQWMSRMVRIHYITLILLHFTTVHAYMGENLWGAYSTVRLNTHVAKILFGAIINVSALPWYPWALSYPLVW